MQRWIWVAVAALTVVFIGVVLAAPDCTASRCVYMPVVAAPRTPTLAPTLTLTPTLTLEPTLTPTPSNTPTPTNTPAPTSTPSLPPPSFNNCQPDPNPGLAPNYPVRIVTIDKVAETVTLQNISSGAIDLTGWHMCSITGNQEHPIGGTLSAGQTATFLNTGGPIWNNALSDPGALYNPGGQLVSYSNN